MLDTEPLYREAWQKAALLQGHLITDDLYLRTVGQRVPESEAMFAALFGETFSVDEFRTQSGPIYDEIVATRGVSHKPGLLELLEFLVEKEIPRAVASSNGRRAVLKLLGSLAKYFDPVVTGDEVKRGKPAPDIFLLAASRLGVAPEDCLVLEDADTGARAAKAAGMTVIVVPDLVPPSIHASRVCHSLHEVHALLRAEIDVRKVET